MHIFTEYVAKYLSLKMLIFGLSWLEHSPSIMSIVFIKKKNATALQQRWCFFPFNTSMVWGEINLLNKGGLKMNLAFLISFMTFHFYLNLAFHTNIFTIRIVIVIYFNFF